MYSDEIKLFDSSNVVPAFCVAWSSYAYTSIWLSLMLKHVDAVSPPYLNNIFIFTTANITNFESPDKYYFKAIAI